MQKLFALALLCLALLATPAQAATEGAPEAAHPSGTRIGIAAIVNDDAITWSDIDNRARLFIASANKGAPPPEARQQIEAMVLNRLIDEKLQLREAKNLGIIVSDDQLEKAFADIARQNNLQSAEFKQRLVSSGIKPGALLEQIRAEVAWSLVVRRKLRPQINVSENEIDTAMDQLQSRKGQTEYQVSEILLKVPSAEMETTVRTDAEKLVRQITEGAQFSQVAHQLSQAPGAATGGDLGWLQEGQLGKELDAQLATMHPGEVSPPIRTDKGYHILFLRNLRDAGSAMAPQPRAPQPTAPPQAAAAAPVASAPAADPARPGLVQAETVLHLKQLVIPVEPGEAAPIVSAKLSRAESLKGEITSCDAMEQKAREFLAEGTGDLGSSNLSQLSEPVRKAVATLPVGELSEPVRTDNGIAVLMVCEREDTPGAPMPAQTAEAPAPTPAPATAPEAAQATATPAPAATPAATSDGEREQVANQIGMKRLNQLADRYLKDLRATAYIERR